MSTYYIKGGSKYNEANPKVWVTLFLGGFDDSKYTDANWKNIDYDFGGVGAVVTNDDPFWRLGGSSGGAKEFELGLWSDNRIKVDASGYWYWDGVEFKDLITAVGPHDLDSHSDVVITTPADNEVLAWDNVTTKWINQTPSEAGLSVSGHNHAHNDLTGLNDGVSYEHITQTQKNALHDIYTLEQHNNTHHSTNYKPDFSENSAFNKNFGTLSNTVCVGNDARLSDARTPVSHNNTYHSETYVTAVEAVSAVESTGLTMGNSINLQENTLTVGNAGVTDPITLITFETERSWYFRKRSTGASTTLNLECDTSGKSFRIGYTNLPIMSFNTNSVDANARINAHNHKIIELANAVNPQDAMAFGQKYTLEQHDNTHHSTNYLPNVVADVTPQLGADLDCQHWDIERAGTVYHTDATRWLARISSTGFDTGTLYDIGIKWDTGANKQLEVVGYNNLYLGIRTDHDVVDINASGMRIGGANARINEISTDGTLAGNSDVAVPTEKAVKTYVDGAGGGGFSPPIGYITMFSGTWTDNVTIPGWYKCDGNNGTVNLVDKFVRGGSASGATGGSDNAVVVSHSHGITDSGHEHRTYIEDGGGGLGVGRSLSSKRIYTSGKMEVTATGITVNNAGVSGTGANKPAYYTLIFIQRIS